MSKPKKSRPGKIDSNSKGEVTNCDGCCSVIDDSKDEALQCEGICQKWYHRLCAGVSKFHYDRLADSPQPFICWLCSNITDKAVIRHLQQELETLRNDFAVETEANRSEIAALKEENAALQASLRGRTQHPQAVGGSAAGNSTAVKKESLYQCIAKSKSCYLYLSIPFK